MANLSPTKAKATYAEGLAKAKQNKLFEARALFSSVAEAFPNAPEAWYQMGLIDRQIGRPLTAAQCFERAAQTKPDQYEILKELEQTARLVGRSDYAVELNKKLRTLRPQDPAPFVNMGLAQQQMGEFDAAEKTFKRAQQKWPKSGGLYRVWFQGKNLSFRAIPH
ncbi:tetratricopeptide repeat protein [Roseobacteraceae bacterium S113]